MKFIVKIVKIIKLFYYIDKYCSKKDIYIKRKIKNIKIMIQNKILYLIIFDLLNNIR